MKVLVASNLFPSKDYQALGVFVKNFISELDEIGVDYDTVFINLKRGKIAKLFSYISYFARFLFKGLFGKYEILYVHYVSHNAILSLIIKTIRKDKKLYVNAHGSDVIPQTKTQKIMQKYVRKLLLRSDKIIVPSNYFVEMVSRRFNISKNKFCMYPSGGINNNIIKPMPLETDFFRQYKLEMNKIYIGFVSRIADSKGWDVYLKAFKKIVEHKDYTNVDAIVVGTGEQKTQFLEMIRTLEIKNRVHYIEQMPQSELAMLYNVMELFVFPTSRASESLGLVGLEAMATKTNIIASDFAAPKHIIDHGVNGFKIEVGNVDHLYETMVNYLRLDEEEKNRLAENAYKTASKYFRENVRNELKKIILD